MSQNMPKVLTEEKEKTNTQKKNSIILYHRCSPTRIILIVTTGRMMELKAFPKIQLILLNPEIDGVNRLLHGHDGLLHG
jgi:hypothetical protein